MKKYLVATVVCSLVGSQWQIESINGVAINTSKYKGSKPSITFDASGRFYAYAGCNRISGGYTASEKILKFSDNIIMTKMACHDNEHLEKNFIATLPKVEHWKIVEDKLQLESSDNVNLMVLAPRPS